MIRFLDGPAVDVVLDLRRAPLFLRAVCGRGGRWDALDQLGDTPRPDERIHVYRRLGEPTTFHLCIRGKGRNGSGWRSSAAYRYLPDQPADADVRETAAWRAWCYATKDRPPAGTVPAAAAAERKES